LGELNRAGNLTYFPYRRPLKEKKAPWGRGQTEEKKKRTTATEKGTKSSLDKKISGNNPSVGIPHRGEKPTGLALGGGPRELVAQLGKVT